MENIEILISKHSTGDYSLHMAADDTTITVMSHAYNHRAGNHSALTFQGITLDDMVNLASAILTSVMRQKKENEDPEPDRTKEN